jgi:hypothetical protein
MAVESIEIDAQSMTLSMSQSGPTVFYSETQPSCEEADITDLGSGFYMVHMEANDEAAKVVVMR